MSRNILIIGGSGFIGSRLAKEFIRLGDHVTISSRMSSKSLIDDADDGRHELVKCDITDKRQVEHALKDDFDSVISLASSPLTDVASKNPEGDAKVSIEGVLNILDCIKKRDTLFVYFSTSLVYGKGANLPITESHPTNPLIPYGQNRLKSEQNCKKYNDLFGLRYMILRPSPVYGPGRLPQQGSGSGVVGIFVNRLLENKDITINGDGSLIRDFVYIDDAVNATITLINQNQYNEVFNICSGEQTTLRRLAELCLEKIKPRSAKIVYNNSVKTDTDLYLSAEKISNAGFTPRVSLTDGLDRYIDWCRKIRRKTSSKCGQTN